MYALPLLSYVRLPLLSKLPFLLGWRFLYARGSIIILFITSPLNMFLCSFFCAVLHEEKKLLECGEIVLPRHIYFASIFFTILLLLEIFYCLCCCCLKKTMSFI